MRHARASVLVAPLAILVLLGSTLVGTDRLGFRDVSHFYTPLYDYVSQRHAVAWVPLWNPLDQTGIPLVGETTTAVFYPVRFLVYWMTADAEVAMAWYVGLHLILASISTWLAARWSGITAVVASIGAAAYALSGSVLFLYCNPPFLVGAAWMPLAAGTLLGREGPPPRARWTIAAIAIAMMVLGGDPQTALHVMIMVAAVWLFQRVRGVPTPLTFRQLMLVPLTAAVLAAPQIAASLDWSRHSDRVHHHEPADSWFTPPIVGSSRHQSFEYSLPPWQTIEMLAPNVLGNLFPANERVSRLLPGDGRMWTPSIYMGMLVAIVFLARLWKWRSGGIDIWMGIALFSLSLAMGHFGIVWWIQATTGALDSVDSAVGGPYWFAYHFIPGYDSFRYPAKWLTVFAFATAMTTASFLDQEGSLARLRRITLSSVLTLTIAAIAMWLASSAYTLVHEGTSLSSLKDEFWGPLQPESAYTQITLALVHACFVTAILTWLVWGKRSVAWSTPTRMWVLLLVLVVDTSIASRNMILRIPRVTEQRLIDDANTMSDLHSRRWMRTQSNGGWPRIWAETSSPRRAIEVEASERIAWFGRWHLPAHEGVLNNMVSIGSHEVAMFWEASRSVTETLTPQAKREFWQAVRRWLGVHGIIHTSGRSKEVSLQQHRYQLVDRTTATENDDELLEAHDQWTIVNDAEPDLPTMKGQLVAIVAAKGQPIPTIQRGSHSRRPIASVIREPIANAPTIASLQESEEQAMCDVELHAPTLLTRCVYQDGNWSAAFQKEGSTEWIKTEVYQVDFLKQGVVIPAGKHRLKFLYHPWWLDGSLCITLAGWIGIAIYLPMQNRLKTRSRMSSV